MPRVITSQSRTNLGPLTATFTPEPGCTHFVGLCDTCAIAWLSETCGKTGAQDDPSCWPPTRVGAASPSPTLNGWGFYSPGLVCPSGFTSACIATAGGSSGWMVQFSMTAEETAVGCCPSGFQCANINGGTCTAVPTSTTVPIVTCSDGASVNFTQLTITESATHPYTFYAPLIQINWKASDRPATVSATATSTTDPSITPSSHKPSNGVIAGAVIGSVVGLTLLIVLAVFLIRRGKTAETATKIAEPSHPTNERPSYNPQDSSGSSRYPWPNLHVHVNNGDRNGTECHNYGAGSQNNSQGAGNQFNGEVDTVQQHPATP
ncbi:unnamed protein product [Clonostachys rosea]|uniref:Mid2 domain-containing protein n=1 Tax=Bionectria ochroleuca TaxID=29856 RepID=A0ABY6UWG0_BIOOC|nr:unnamed protein product [Clonostachys rosea]